MVTKFMSFLSYKNLIITNIIIVILKIMYVTMIQKEFSTLEDYTIAYNLVNYHQYSEYIQQGGTAFKLPVYPFFIGFFLYFLGDKALIGVAVFQAILSFFSPVFIYRILKLFGYEKIGVLSGILFIVSPAYFLYPEIIEASNVFIPILLLWFYLYFRIWFLIDVKKSNFVILGVVTALLFLTQVVIVPLSCLMILGLLLFKKSSFKNVFYLVFTVIVLYSPWIVRNYFVFDKIILSKSPVWQNIYYGFTPNGQLLDDLKLITNERDDYLYHLRNDVNELKMEEIYKKEVEKMTHWESSYFIKKAASNLLCLWYVPPKYFYDNSLSILFGRKIYVILLDFFTIMSLILLYRKSKALFYFSILFFVSFSFPYVIGHAANTRFKLDFEWYQLILVSFVVIELINKNKKAL
ncbi:MAG: hypothetical protein DI529_04265 [Chryseobacterium sp.]|nr:MAG: hypothetical protein DI529_04265 [Chryseobacterium sp.]